MQTSAIRLLRRAHPLGPSALRNFTASHKYDPADPDSKWYLMKRGGGIQDADQFLFAQDIADKVAARL